MLKKLLIEAQNHIDDLSKVVKAAQGEYEGILDCISDKFKDAVLGKRKTMYLYLIDEHTGNPISDETYPIEIKVASKKMKKWAPVMMLSWKSISLLNNAAAVARMFLPGILVLDEVLLEKFGDKIEKLQSTGNGLIKNAIKSAEGVKSAKDAKSVRVRGAQLREYSQYLLEVDSKKTFAGLCRVYYTNGNAIWVMEASKNELEKDTLNESEVKLLVQEKFELAQQKNALEQQNNAWEQQNNTLEKQKNDLERRLKRRFTFNCCLRDNQQS